MDHQEIRCADRFKPSLGAIRQQLLQQLGLTKTAQIKAQIAGESKFLGVFPSF